LILSGPSESLSSSSLNKHLRLIRLFLGVKNTNGSCRCTSFEDGEYDDDTGELDAERVDDDGKCTGEVDTGVAMLGEQESAILCIFFLCF